MVKVAVVVAVHVHLCVVGWGCFSKWWCEQRRGELKQDCPGEMWSVEIPQRNTLDAGEQRTTDEQ